MLFTFETLLPINCNEKTVLNINWLENKNNYFNKILNLYYFWRKPQQKGLKLIANKSIKIEDRERTGEKTMETNEM